jgi:hypothetical protein
MAAAGFAVAMKAVTSAPAGDAITPCEAATSAAVADTFVLAAATSDFGRRLRQGGGRRDQGAEPVLQLLGEVLL